VRKTKKEKIEAAARRERFLYSLSSIQQAPQEKKELNQQEKPAQATNQPQTPMENFSYLKTDLRRIVILALFAFAVQIVLYLTIF